MRRSRNVTQLLHEIDIAGPGSMACESGLKHRSYENPTSAPCVPARYYPTYFTTTVFMLYMLLKSNLRMVGFQVRKAHGNLNSNPLSLLVKALSFL
jgi:hypothetical protein